MARNLVVCCDGTNKSPWQPATNVRHLSRIAAVPDESLQRVFHDVSARAGADPDVRARVRAAIGRWSGSAFGTGLVENVDQVYRELIRHHAEGDRVFLFGFSRGAYTVRVIAALLHEYGLLRKENEADAAYVIKAFQDLYPPTGTGFENGIASPQQQVRFDEARRIRNLRSVPCPIHFMGLFDSVSSLGWARDPKIFPNVMTRPLPNVRILRHAMALDERRTKFRADRITVCEDVDDRQVWFAGVHADVGGGYAAPRDRLSRVPLRWMLREARSAGMLVNEAVLAAYDLDNTCMDDEQADQNESLTVVWRTLEYLPLSCWRKKDGEWVKERRIHGGRGWRELSETFDAHESLQRRRQPVKNVFWEETLPSIHYRD